MPMLKRLQYALQGTLALMVVSVSTIILAVVIFVLALFKLVAPRGTIRNTLTRWLSALGELWISVNQFVIRFYRGLKWDIRMPDSLRRDGSYLVFCNHQSWVDILVLQHCLNRRAPFMRFLLKQELIWVPFLGLAWWALDMAFLRRYSKQQLLKKPELRGKDLENAAKACEKLRHIPVSMMTFPEGTRFTTEKHAQQKSRFRHLLRPRYGGIGQVLYSFDDSLDSLIDVTITYPGGAPSLWQFVSGQVNNISVSVRELAIDERLRGKNFREDAGAKHVLKTWLTGIWEDKDRFISQACETGAAPSPDSRRHDNIAG